MSRLFYPEYGGPGISLWRLAPRLVRKGVRLTVLTRGAGELPAREVAIDVEIHRLPAGDGFMAEARWIIAVLRQLIRSRKHYDIIHVFHSGWLTFLVPCLGRVLRKPACFTMTLLGSDDPVAIDSMRFRWIKVKLFRMYQKVLYINDEQARRYEQIYATRAPLIPGSLGVDMSHFHAPARVERDAARKALKLTEGQPVAAFVGALVRRKGVDRAVGIWMRVCEQFPEAVLLLLGPDGGRSASSEEFIRAELEAAIRSEGRAENFRFLGESRDLHDVLRVLHASDLFLFPSRREGTPSAVLEAMACAVPCVVGNLEGFSGVIVRDGIEGLVLGDEDAGTSAARIGRLLQDPQLRKTMGSQCRVRADLTHSQAVAVRGYLQAWRARKCREAQGAISPADAGDF